MKPLLFALAVLGLSGCTKPDSARKLLEREGFTDIQITGLRFFGCSEDDWFKTGFKAKKNGQGATGVVCAGLLFKGATVRFDD